MSRVYLAAESIVSPLGTGSVETYDQIHSGKTALNWISDSKLLPFPFVGGQIADLEAYPGFTRFETLCIKAIEDIQRQGFTDFSKTLFILSTTKGNIDLIEHGIPKLSEISLSASALKIQQKFGFKKSLALSNACISGVLAVTIGQRMLEWQDWDQVLVLGADELSHFVLSGFQSLMALSDGFCKPFDAERNGINLGEAAAAVLLKKVEVSDTLSDSTIMVLGGSSSNDANHISGPSRTGEELALAIKAALKNAKTDVSEIDCISAHGTATVYNDEMEAKAFHAAGMGEIPLNSLKGYFGHTLGAAGLIEIIISSESLRRNEWLPTLGFQQSGVSQKLNLSNQLISRDLRTCLKTASGFGACNAAIILQKGH